MPGSYSFEIESPEKLLAVLTDDLRELQASPKSSRHAIHCAFLAWHLHEWVWAKKFKGDEAASQRSFAAVLRTKKEFVARVRIECPDIEIMQGVAEGTKHLGTSAAVKGTVDDLSTSQLGSAQLGRLQLGGTGVLGVQMSDGRMVAFLPAVHRVAAYWKQLITVA